MIYVYMIKNEIDRLYVGVTHNVEKRIEMHNRKAGAVFTMYGKFRIVFIEQYLTLKEARSREVQIKKWRREKKEALIRRYSDGLQTKPE